MNDNRVYQRIDNVLRLCHSGTKPASAAATVSRYPTRERTHTTPVCRRSKVASPEVTLHRPVAVAWVVFALLAVVAMVVT